LAAAAAAAAVADVDVEVDEFVACLPPLEEHAARPTMAVSVSTLRRKSVTGRTYDHAHQPRHRRRFALG
jgi:hypothetical protein